MLKGREHNASIARNVSEFHSSAFAPLWVFRSLVRGKRPAGSLGMYYFGLYLGLSQYV